MLYIEHKNSTITLQEYCNEIKKSEAQDISTQGFFSKVFKSIVKTIHKLAKKVLKVIAAPLVYMYDIAKQAIDSMLQYVKSCIGWAKRNWKLILAIVIMVAVAYFCAGAVAAYNVSGATTWYSTIGSGIVKFGGWLSESYSQLTALLSLAWSNLKKGVTTLMDYASENAEVLKGAATYGMAAWGAYELADTASSWIQTLLSSPYTYIVIGIIILIYSMKDRDSRDRSYNIETISIPRTVSDNRVW